MLAVGNRQLSCRVISVDLQCLVPTSLPATPVPTVHHAMATVTVGAIKYGSLGEAMGGAKPGDTISISGAHTGQQLAIPATHKGGCPRRAPPAAAVC